MAQSGVDPSGGDFETDLLGLYPQLKSFARRLCGDGANADDIAQAALARAWRFRGSFGSGGDLRAWLFTIARNQFHSVHRRNWREVALDEGVQTRTPAKDCDQNTWLELSDTLAAVRHLGALSREALLLIAVAGFSYSETATICSCSVGTIKSRVWQARRDLVAILEGRRKAGARPLDRGRGAAFKLLAEIDALAYQRVFDPKSPARVERRLSQLQARHGLSSDRA
jgi:RNA polymerase sigma-70 factor (ECF subfamily)